MKNTRGRPKKTESKRRTEVIAMLVTAKEKKRIVKAAKNQEQKVSSFVREMVLEAI